MKRIVFPGSFDPITLGHVNLVSRALRCCDEVVVAVLDNAQKKTAFTLAERAALCEQVFADFPAVSVRSHAGLLMRLMEEENTHLMMRGLRDAADAAHELRLFQIYHALDSDIETLYWPATPETAHLSSSAVRAIAQAGGDISAWVPAAILDTVRSHPWR